MLQCKQISTLEKYALVFMGGGVNGAYSSKFLQNIAHTYPVTPKILAGSSIGAYIAALTAEVIFNNGTLEDACKKTVGLWQDLSRRSPIIPSLLNIITLRGIFSANNIKRFLRKYIDPQRKIGDYLTKDIKLIITGTSLKKGTTELFKSELNVIDAVVASGAFPVAFPSQRITDSYYTDGGVLENTPLSPVIDAGATDISVFFLNPESNVEGAANGIGSNSTYKNIFPVLGRVINISIAEVLYQDIQFAKGINEIVKIVEDIKDENLKKEFQENLAKFQILFRKLLYSKKKELNLLNKKYVNIREYYPSADLGNLFNWSKKAMDFRFNLAYQDAQNFLESIKH